MNIELIYTILSILSALIQICESYYYTKQTLIFVDDSSITLLNQPESEFFSVLRSFCGVMSIGSVVLYLKKHKLNSNWLTVMIFSLFTPPRINCIVEIEVPYQLDSLISILSTLKFLEIFKMLLKQNDYFSQRQSFSFAFKSLNQFRPLMLISSIYGLFFGVFSYIIFVLEFNKQPSHFFSLPQSGYFVIVAVTSVGYGDLIPQTQMGKIFTNFICLSGQVILSLLVTLLIGLLSLSQQEEQRIISFSTPFCQKSNSFQMSLGRKDDHSEIAKIQQGMIDELDYLIELMEPFEAQQRELTEINQILDKGIILYEGMLKQ